MASPDRRDPRDTLATVIWAMIYSGLLLAGIGLYTTRTDAVTGWIVAVVGAFDALVGFVLIVVRARMGDAPTPQEHS